MNKKLDQFRRFFFNQRSNIKIASNKKYSKEQLYLLVVESLQDGIGKHPNVDKWYAEPIAIHLKTKTHFVKQVFHKLNLQGKMSKAKRWNSHTMSGTMHTRLDWHNDQVVMWEANYYTVYLDKL